MLKDYILYCMVYSYIKGILVYSSIDSYSYVAQKTNIIRFMCTSIAKCTACSTGKYTWLVWDLVRQLLSMLTTTLSGTYSYIAIIIVVSYVIACWPAAVCFQHACSHTSVLLLMNRSIILF